MTKIVAFKANMRSIQQMYVYYTLSNTKEPQRWSILFCALTMTEL